jgi:FtsZ-interacting cell division protein ZipA
MEWIFLIAVSVISIVGLVIFGIWDITKSKKRIKMYEESNKRKLEEYLKE